VIKGFLRGRAIKHVDPISDFDLTGIKVMQIVGSLGSGTPSIDGPKLVYNLADRLHGTYKYVNSPEND
jgi:deoxyribonucleoside regulator